MESYQDFQNQDQTPAPPPRASKLLMVLSVLVFLIVLGGISFYIKQTRNEANQSKNPNPVPVTADKSGSTIDTKPVVINATPTDAANFPKEILAIFPASPINLQVKSAVFDKGQGFIADFQVPNNNPDKHKLYTDLLSQSRSLSMQVIYSSYSDTVITAFLYDQKNKILIDLSFGPGQFNKIHIETWQ